jgi:hypothetical protein
MEANKIGIKVVNDILEYPDTIGSCIYHSNGYYYNNKNRVINYKIYGIGLWRRIKEIR